MEEIKIFTKQELKWLFQQQLFVVVVVVVILKLITIDIKKCEKYKEEKLNLEKYIRKKL